VIKRETKKNIFDHFEMENISFAGRMKDVEFLDRLYPLKKMESSDSRYENAYGDIWQHTENNFDYERNWVFRDSRFELLDGSDDQLLKFLCEMIHPLVRPDQEEALKILNIANDWLRIDGWELRPSRKIAGGNIYAFKVTHGSPEPMPSEDDLAHIWTSDGLRLFVSHRDRHKAEAKQLAIELNKYGISSFVAHESIQPMTVWKNEILKSLRTMDACLCYITNDFYESEWTNQEIGFALNKGVPIYLYSVDKTDPKGFKLDIQAIKTGLPELLKCIKADFANNHKFKKSFIEKFVGAQDVSFDAAKNSFFNLVGLNYDDNEIEEIVSAITAKTKNVNKLVVVLIDAIKDDHKTHPLLRKYAYYHEYLNKHILAGHTRKIFSFNKTGEWTFEVKETRKTV